VAGGTLFFARVFVKKGQSRSKGAKMMSKWLKIVSKGVIQKCFNGTTCRNCHQIPPQGRSRSHRFAPFGPPGGKFGPQRLQAPFAANFGIHFGIIDSVLAIWGPCGPTLSLCPHPNGQKRAKKGPNGPKMAQNDQKWPPKGV